MAELKIKVGGAIKFLDEEKGADIASASTTDLSTATGPFINVTGVATINALGVVTAGIRRMVRFTGDGTITYHATSLILPSGASIERVAGDCAVFESLGTGNWRCLFYHRFDGTSLVANPFDQSLNTSDEVAFNSISRPGGAKVFDLSQINKVIFHPDAEGFYIDADGYHGPLSFAPSGEDPTTPGTPQGWVFVNIEGVGTRYLPYYGNPP